jgi:hypothetical protein
VQLDKNGKLICVLNQKHPRFFSTVLITTGRKQTDISYHGRKDLISRAPQTEESKLLDPLMTARYLDASAYGREEQWRKKNKTSHERGR